MKTFFTFPYPRFILQNGFCYIVSIIFAAKFLIGSLRLGSSWYVIPPNRISFPYKYRIMLLSTVFCTCSFVKSLLGMRSITIFLFSPGFNPNLLSSIPSNFSLHPADVNSRGNSTFNSIIALRRNELPAKKEMLMQSFHQSIFSTATRNYAHIPLRDIIVVWYEAPFFECFGSRQIVDIARVPIS